MLVVLLTHAGSRHAAAYIEEEVTTATAVFGNVSWLGDVPSPVKFEVNVDKNHCAPMGELTESLITVDEETRAVSGAVVFLEKVRHGLPLDTFTTLPLTTTARECHFYPSLLISPHRWQIKFLSEDNALHELAFFPSETDEKVSLPTSGWREKVRVPEPGIYEIRCSRHRWEQLYLFSIEHPYYSVTAADGSFALTQVPAGRYSLVAWHKPVAAKAVMKNGFAVDYIFEQPLVVRRQVTLHAAKPTEVEIDLSAISE